MYVIDTEVTSLIVRIVVKHTMETVTEDIIEDRTYANDNDNHNHVFLVEQRNRAFSCQVIIYLQRRPLISNCSPTDLHELITPNSTNTVSEGQNE